MRTVQKSFRLPEATIREIELVSKESGQDFSCITKDLIEEALKMRRCPGILFASGVTGRRARVAGTGIEVWEIISQLKHFDHDEELLKESFHWLTSSQIRSALSYYKLYPDEINSLIARNEAWTEDFLQERYPALSAKQQ